MDGSRIRIIHKGHLFVIFTYSFTDKLNTLSISPVVDTTIEKIVSNKLTPIIIVISETEDVQT